KVMIPLALDEGEGKTDYYNTPKYRMIVRITNREIFCQVRISLLTWLYKHCLFYLYPKEGKKAVQTLTAEAEMKWC
uniref:Uncharacterized protein n=1 Tax=Gopherus agassizii TaxID=38772 RepID=A0A452HSA4_9SAUR